MHSIYLLTLTFHATFSYNFLSVFLKVCNFVRKDVIRKLLLEKTRYGGHKYNK